MISSGSHHTALPRAVWMEPQSLHPSSAERRETASEALYMKSRAGLLRLKAKQTGQTEK